MVEIPVEKIVNRYIEIPVEKIIEKQVQVEVFIEVPRIIE